MTYLTFIGHANDEDTMGGYDPHLDRFLDWLDDHTAWRAGDSVPHEVYREMRDKYDRAEQDNRPLPVNPTNQTGGES